MAKRKRGFTDNKYEKWLKEGRGQGEKSTYKPWLTIQDVSSMGNVTRVYSHKTGRQHEFLSNNELYYFYLLEFADSVIDIREQYPLLYREDTLAIAKEIGIKHPSDISSKDYIVMTTDFLVTEQFSDKNLFKARTVKGRDELENKRVIEKFEIERLFWCKKGVDWGIVTGEEINKPLAMNLEYLRGFHNIDNHTGISDISERNRLFLLSKLQDILVTNLGQKLREILFDFDRNMNLEIGTSITMFNYLLYTKKIKMDLNHKINLECYEPIEKVNTIEMQVKSG
ncbi:TnsA endonuclease N-terminal domain-containing protein [Vallitalea sp.]|jgi:hypothetical protein|uniref:TnsA endonuclease N-terminal domain-containing protein n=1 Tax=Vallitalea sp. TaxID=1882829 RepID=UPI0025FAFCF0|nr:TnsA endonuclease N-terminal domain-containing protein [Vallitalea sp.]MCT4686860.1 TnsA endonuclease N-terminal domain-containing protein [Vallitalea sp.]